MKPSERNEITNKELKEMLADTALEVLTPEEDYNELAGTTVQFGYLFDIDNHGLEMLDITNDDFTISRGDYISFSKRFDEIEIYPY